MKFKKVDELPKDAMKLKRKELAWGEVTGHAHRLGDVGELFETKNGELYLSVPALKKATVSHEEHKTITLEPGCYRVGIKRQYNPEGSWEKVVD